MGKPILCLDFDGVIHSYRSGWQGANVVSDSPVDGAFDFIMRALEHFDVQVYSSRSNQNGGITAMQVWMMKRFGDWLKANSVLGHKQSRSQQHIEAYAESIVIDTIGWPVRKPPAMVTIDDRAVTFNGTWPELDVLLSFKPWNKRETAE